MLEHAVGLGRANLGEDDPDVLTTALQLAQVLLQADDPVGARRVLEDSYSAGQWRLGDSAPVMVLISHAIGVAAEELGNRHEARKAFGRVAEHGPQALGPDHGAVAAARGYLGDDPPTVRMELPAPPPVSAPSHGFGSDGGFDTRGQGGEARFGEPAAAYLEPVRAYDREPADRSAQVFPPLGPAARETPQISYARKAPALVAAIAAVLAAIIAGIALILVLAQRNDHRDDPNVPTLGGGPAPTDVRLRDFGTSISVYWSDPANGTTSFIVSGGRPGEVLKPMGQVSPGQTTLGLNGLNPGLDYCFAVVAVYSSKDFASSPQACTSRKGVTAGPSTTE